MLPALGAVFDRLLDALFGGAYRKFGQRRYELRLEVRDLLKEANRIIDSSGYASLAAAILDQLDNRVGLLPDVDKAIVTPAQTALIGLTSLYTSAYESQERHDANKVARYSAKALVATAIDHLGSKVRL